MIEALQTIPLPICAYEAAPFGAERTAVYRMMRHDAVDGPQRAVSQRYHIYMIRTIQFAEARRIHGMV